MLATGLFTENLLCNKFCAEKNKPLYVYFCSHFKDEKSESWKSNLIEIIEQVTEPGFQFRFVWFQNLDT